MISAALRLRCGRVPSMMLVRFRSQTPSACGPRLRRRCRPGLQFRLLSSGASATGGLNQTAEELSGVGDAESAHRKSTQLEKTQDLVSDVDAALANVLINSHAKEGQVDEAGKLFEQSLKMGIELDTNSIASLICACVQHGDVDRASRWLHEMKQADIQPPVEAYNAIIIARAERGKQTRDQKQVKEAGRILDEMWQESIEPNVNSFSHLIDAWTQLGDVEQASRWFNKMKRVHPQPPVKTYSALIKARTELGKETRDLKQIEEAGRLLTSMLRSGIQPHGFSFTTLIDGYSQFQNIPMADYWFRAMIRSGRRPTVETASTLINAHAKRGKETRNLNRYSLKQAEWIFREMVRRRNAPSVVLFTSLINAYVQLGDFARARLLFLKMKRANVQPTVETYNVLINAHSKQGKKTKNRKEIEGAERILEHMLKSDVADAISFTSVIDACAQLGDINSASQWFDSMKQAKVQPTVETYDVLINARAKRAKQTRDPKHIREAERILEAMESAGIRPNAICFTSLIDACAQLGAVYRASHWFDAMKRANLQPTVATYSAIINARAKRGKLTGEQRQVEEAEQMLEEMLNEGVKPNLICFTSLVDVCAQLGHVDRVSYWLDKMKRANLSPDVHIYSILINAHAKRGKATKDRNQVTKAERVFDEMLNAGIEPNVISFTSLIDACGQLGELDRACLWFDEMKSMGHEPNLRTYSSMLNACLKANNDRGFELAIELYEEMQRIGIESNRVIFGYVLNTCANASTNSSAVLQTAENAVSEMKRLSKKVRPGRNHLRACMLLHKQHPTDVRPKEWIQWMIENGAKSDAKNGQNELNL